MKDVIIIGAGPAGLTAALYAARAGLSVQVFEKNVCGGQVAITDEVENYPAIQKISGADFSLNIYNQVVDKHVEILFEEVQSVDFSGKAKMVITSSGEHSARSVIIANGVKRRKLGCRGEDEFYGRGVSYCATCDGAFFKGKDVAVVGAGNTALEDALFLANICKSVTLLIRRGKARAEKALLDAATAKSNINLCYSTVVNEIGGNDGGSVSFANVFDKAANKEKTLEVAAVFIAIGLEPDNGMFADFVDLDEDGYILADERCNTSVDGIFVAGDTRKKHLRQIVTAASDGAIAADNVSRYLNS